MPGLHCRAYRAPGLARGPRGGASARLPLRAEVLMPIWLDKRSSKWLSAPTAHFFFSSIWWRARTRVSAVQSGAARRLRGGVGIRVARGAFYGTRAGLVRAAWV